MRAPATRTARDDLAALASLPRAALAYLGRAAERLTSSATARIPNTPLSSVMPTPRGGQLGEANDWNALEAVKANTGHAFSSINFTANQIETLAQSMRLTARRRGARETVVIEDHYILEALDDPNSLYTGPEMLGLAAGWELSAGFCAWAKVRDDDSRQLQFWPLLPHLTKLVAGKVRPVDGVNYYPDGFGGKAIGFAREDVVLFRTRSLVGGLYGWPPLRAALWEKSITDKSLRMRLAEIDNRARPDYILAPKLPVGKERPKALATFWANLMLHHQGIDKTGLPLVVPDGTTVSTLGFSAEQFQLIEQLNLSRDNLFEILGTSALLHGHTESYPARATLETEVDRYGAATLEPLATNLWGALNRDIVGELNAIQPTGVRLRLERDSAIKGDRDWLLRAATELFKAGLTTRNQSLKLVGQPTIEGPEGDERAPLASAGGIPLANARVSASTAAEIAKELAPSVSAEMQGWLAKQIAALPVVTDPIEVRALPPAPVVRRTVTHPTSEQLDTDEKRADFWAKQIKPQDDHTKRATKILDSFFRTQAARVLPAMEPHIEALGAKFHGASRAKVLRWFAEVERKGEWLAVFKMGKDEPGGFDIPGERDHLAETLRPIARTAASDGGDLLANQLGLSWSVESPKVTAWLETHVTQTAADITDTSAQLLSAVIRDGVADEKTTSEIMRDLRTVFGSWSDQTEDTDAVMPGYRAARIARTEIGTAFGRSQQLVLEDAKDEGLVESKMWLSARDEHVRDSHRIDGETVDVEGEFSNGLKYPGDPSAGPGEICNCRCTIAAVVKGA